MASTQDPSTTAPRNGMGLAALILGVVGLAVGALFLALVIASVVNAP